MVGDHGTLPNDDLYRALKPFATNCGEPDLHALVNAADLSAILFSLGDCPALGPCPSDLDDNGTVEILDVIDLFFGVPCEPGNCIFDFNGDGTASAEDLLIYAYFVFI